MSIPIATLGLAALCCLGPTLGLGVDFGRGTDLGPIADVFYRLYRAGSSPTTNEQLFPLRIGETAQAVLALNGPGRTLLAQMKELRVLVVP
jgi:hypothetical protein